MNQKLTSIETKPAQPTPTPKHRRAIRRQIDLGLVTGPGPGFLLSYEDPDALQTLRQSVVDSLGARTPIELVVAEFAVADAWHGLRAHRLHGATVDTEVADNADAVDREYSDVDTTSRTALIYKDTGVARVLRQFERTAALCHRSIRHVFPMRAGKTRD